MCSCMYVCVYVCIRVPVSDGKLKPGSPSKEEARRLKEEMAACAHGAAKDPKKAPSQRIFAWTFGTGTLNSQRTPKMRSQGSNNPVI